MVEPALRAGSQDVRNQTSRFAAPPHTAKKPLVSFSPDSQAARSAGSTFLTAPNDSIVKIHLRTAALALLAGACFLQAADLPVASAESMDGLMSAWVSGFSAQHPESPAVVALHGKFSADFAEPLGRGEIRVAPFARELFASERARVAQLAGAEPWLIPVATGSRATKGGTHAIVIFVNAKNPLTQLSLTQLREVLGRGGRMSTWGDLGLTGEWANRPIRVHGMKVRRDTGNPPGIVNFLEGRLLGGRGWREDLHEYLDLPNGSQSLDQIVAAIAADEAAIGYSGFAYALPGAKALALGETDAGPFYAGSEAEVADRRYPLARTLYLATGPWPDATTRGFVAFALSAEGQRAITVNSPGFFPLPNIEPRSVAPTVGARYVNPDGSIAIVGYNDMSEMISALDDQFSADHPGIRFRPVLKGTRTGPPALAAGTTLLAPMGAEFSPTELAEYRAKTGGEPVTFRMAHASLDPRALSGPLAIFVHRDSPVTSMSLSELADIFSGRKTGGWHPFGLAADRALGLFFRARVLAGAEFACDFHGMAQSRDVVAEVASDPAAIGFAAGMRAAPGVKRLSLAPAVGASPVALTEANVRTGEYPLDRHLLLYVRQPIDPLARQYLRWVLSAEGQAVIARGTLGYQPLNEFERAVESAKLAVLPGLP